MQQQGSFLSHSRPASLSRTVLRDVLLSLRLNQAPARHSLPRRCVLPALKLRKLRAAAQMVTYDFKRKRGGLLLRRGPGQSNM